MPRWPSTWVMTSTTQRAVAAAILATVPGSRRCSPRSGPVEIEVPRDTNSTFDPQIVKKRQRRLSGIDEIVLSLTAKGLTTGEVAAHFADVYGATVSKDTISRITDKVVAEMTEWCNRPLESGYAMGFIDAIFVKINDCQVAN